MGVRKRGSKFTVDVYRNGKKEYICTVADEAEAYRIYFEEKQKTTTAKSETVEHFCARYTDDFQRTTKTDTPRWSEVSIRTLHTAFKPFVASFGHMKLRDFARLTASDLRAWTNAQPATYVQRVRTALNDAEADGLISRNPLRGIRLEHSRGRRDITVLDESEIEKLCAVARSTWPDFPGFEAMVAVAAYTTIRPGELFALRVGDVDLEAGSIDVMLSSSGLEVKRPKNGRPRPGLVLLPPVIERIAAMPRKLTEHPCPECRGDRSCIVCAGAGKIRWLFETPQSGMFRKSKLQHYWNPVRAALGQPTMHFYELRHAGAVLLLERGVSVEDVAWQMGHTDGGKLVRELYGEPHRSAEGRRERIRRAFENVTPLPLDDEEAANG